MGVARRRAFDDVRERGMHVPRRVAELYLPRPVGVDIGVIGHDIDRARLLLADEIPEYGTNEGRHAAVCHK